MSSISLGLWRSSRWAALDQMEMAHRGVGGAGPGRRYATDHINQAYAVLLSSHFQGYCRDLYRESVDHLVAAVTPAAFRTPLRDVLMKHCKLNIGNPNPGNIGADFNRLGLIFWDDVRSRDGRNDPRQKRLDELNLWRNAIAHQDFGGRTAVRLRLQQVQVWRQACHQLTIAFDEVMRGHIQGLLGSSPW